MRSFEQSVSESEPYPAIIRCNFLPTCQGVARDTKWSVLPTVSAAKIRLSMVPCPEPDLLKADCCNSSVHFASRISYWPPARLRIKSMQPRNTTSASFHKQALAKNHFQTTRPTINGAALRVSTRETASQGMFTIPRLVPGRFWAVYLRREIKTSYWTWELGLCRRVSTRRAVNSDHLWNSSTHLQQAQLHWQAILAREA